jgi:hypothetical protein
MRHCDPRPCACNWDRNQSPRIGAGCRRGKSLGHRSRSTVAPNGGVAMASPLNRPGVQSRGRVAAFPTSKVGGPPVGGGPWRPNPGAHFAHLRVGSWRPKPGAHSLICIMQMFRSGQSAKFARAEEICWIVLSSDDVIKAAGWTPEVVLRHERGHCNGWPKDHAGARALN